MYVSWGEGSLYRGPRLGCQKAGPEVRLGAGRPLQRPPSGAPEGPSRGRRGRQSAYVRTYEKHILNAHMKSLCSGSQTNAEYIDAEHLTGSTLLRRLFKEFNLYNSLILATFCRSSRSGRLRQSTGAPNCRDPDARDPESRDPKSRKRESRRRESKRRGRRGESPAALAAKTCPDIKRTPNEPSNGKCYHFTG